MDGQMGCFARETEGSSRQMLYPFLVIPAKAGIQLFLSRVTRMKRSGIRENNSDSGIPVLGHLDPDYDAERATISIANRSGFRTA